MPLPTISEPAGRRPIRRVSGPKRLAYVAGGWGLIIASPVIAPLPGPGGIAAAVAGLVLILKHSPRSKRTFVRLSRRHPRFIMPLRKALKEGGLPTDGGITGLPGRTLQRLKNFFWRRRPAV